jgi:hypothetical protein
MILRIIEKNWEEEMVMIYRKTPVIGFHKQTHPGAVFSAFSWLIDRGDDIL